FSALFTLWLSMMAAVGCAVPAPQIEVVVHCALRRQVLRDRTPLTAGRENIHEPIHDLAHDYRALVATWLAPRDQGLDPLPLVVGQIAQIAQLAAVIAGAVLGRPHGGALSSNQATTLESQQIHMIQLLSGQTLRNFKSRSP